MATIQSTLDFQDKMSGVIKKITDNLERATVATEKAKQQMEDMAFAYGTGSKEAMAATVAYANQKREMDSLNATLTQAKNEQQDMARAERQAALEAAFSAQKIKLFGKEVDISKNHIMEMVNRLKQSAKQFSIFSISIGNIIANFGMRTIDGLKNAIAQGIQTASDLAEVQNVVDVTFGNSSDIINKWSKNTLDKFGLNELAAKQYVGTMGSILKSSGITGDAMLEMSTKLTELSGDMASFKNMSNEEAFNKIRAGISGVTMPLQQIGIIMSENNLSAFAMAQGLNVAYNKMSESSKMILRYQYLLNVTKDYQGDFYNTQASFSNQQKLLGQNWKDLSAALANLFVPAMAKGMQVVNGLMKAGVGLIDIIKLLTPALISMAAVVITANIPSLIALGKQYAILGIQAMVAGAKMAAAWLIGLGPIGWITAAVGVLVGALTILINKNKKVAETFWNIVDAIDRAILAFRTWKNRDNQEKVDELNANYAKRQEWRRQTVANVGNKKQDQQDKNALGTGFDWKDLITSGGTGGKALKTKQQGEIEINGEDMQLLHDMATRDYMIKYSHQQLTPQVNLPNVVIHETADVDNVIESLVNAVTDLAQSKLVVT